MCTPGREATLYLIAAFVIQLVVLQLVAIEQSGHQSNA